MLTVGSVFAGIGGLDLGLERAGMRVLWQIENDPYASAVLATHWPGVKRYGDIHALDGSELADVDLICGGVPCQPWSVAGKQRGQDDERDLWPEFMRLVRVLRPRIVFVEEVPGFAVPAGLGRALGDLAEAGFDAEWTCIPAAAVGAPHLRWRLWIVAYAGRAERWPHAGPGDGCKQGADARREEAAGRATERGEVPDADVAILRDKSGRLGWPSWTDPSELGDDGPTQHMGDSASPCGEQQENEADTGSGERRSGTGSVGSGWWQSEPNVGRVANGVPSRVDRLRCLGNAVVPQVAEAIGRMILDAIKPDADPFKKQCQYCQTWNMRLCEACRGCVMCCLCDVEN